MQPTIFHLIGTPGAGKYTIGKLLAEAAGARLVDNHSIANVIFGVLDQDGVRPLPAGTWPLVMRVRRAVLDALVEISPRDLSFVFTNYLRGGDAAEQAIFEEMAAVAEVRGSRFVPVVLACETEELMRRVVGPERKTRMKLVDPIQAAAMNAGPPFTTDHPNALYLDVTRLAPGEAVQQILAWSERP